MTVAKCCSLPIPFDPFFNVNTPDDLAQAQTWAKEYHL